MEADVSQSDTPTVMQSISPNRRLGAVPRDRVRVTGNPEVTVRASDQLLTNAFVSKNGEVPGWSANRELFGFDVTRHYVGIYFGPFIRRRQARSAIGFGGSLGAPGRFIVCKSPKENP
jgi:hypothetical protein